MSFDDRFPELKYCTDATGNFVLKNAVNEFCVPKEEVKQALLRAWNLSNNHPDNKYRKVSYVIGLIAGITGVSLSSLGLDIEE